MTDREQTRREVEQDVIAVRLRLDYPDRDDHRDYLNAVEALDRLATLARQTAESDSE